jgi:hypothetical protein
MIEELRDGIYPDPWEERERADRAEAKAARTALTALTIDGEAMEMSGRIAATVAFVRGSGMTGELQAKLLGLLLGEGPER